VAGSFSDGTSCGAICKPVRGERTELHQDEAYYDERFDHSSSRIMVWLA
jgi:hypothetical protein